MPPKGNRAHPTAALVLLVLITSEHVWGSVQRSNEQNKLREVLNKALNERSEAIVMDNLEKFLEPGAFKEARSFDKKQLEFWSVLDRFGTLTSAEDEFLRETDRLFDAGGSDPAGLMAKVIASRGRVRELFKQTGKGNDDDSVTVGHQTDGSSVPFDPVELLEVESKSESMSREKAMALTQMDPLSAQLVFFFAALAVKLLVKVVTSTVRKYYEHKERVRNMRFMRCANLMSSYAALRRVHPLIRLLAGVREASRRDKGTSNSRPLDTEIPMESVADKQLKAQWKEIQTLEKLIVTQLFEHESKMKLSTICEDQGAVNAIMDNMFMDRIEEAFDRRKLRFDPYDDDPNVADMDAADILKAGDVGKKKDVENNLRPGANVFLETEETGGGLDLFPSEIGSSIIPEMPNYFGWYMVDLLQSLMVAGFEKVFKAIWNGVEKKELAVLCESYALRYRNTYMARLLLRTVKKFAVMTELTGELSNPIPVPKSIFHKMCADIRCEKLGFKLDEKEFSRLKQKGQWGKSPKAKDQANGRVRAPTDPSSTVPQDHLDVEPAPSVASSTSPNTEEWYSYLPHSDRSVDILGSGSLIEGSGWDSDASDAESDYFDAPAPPTSPVRHSNEEKEVGSREDTPPPVSEVVLPFSEDALKRRDRRSEELEQQVDERMSHGPMMHKWFTAKYGQDEGERRLAMGHHGKGDMQPSMDGTDGDDGEHMFDLLKDTDGGGSAIMPYEESRPPRPRPLKARAKSMTAIDDIDATHGLQKQFLFGKLHLETHADTQTHSAPVEDDDDDAMFNPLQEGSGDSPGLEDMPDPPVRRMSDVTNLSGAEQKKSLRKMRAALYRQRVLHLHERTKIKNDFLAKVRRIAVLWLSANYQQGGEFRQNKCVADLCYSNIGTLNGKEYFECRTLCALAGLLHSTSDLDLSVLDLKTYQQIVLYATQIIEKENDAQDILNHVSESCNNPVGAVQLGFESRVFDRFQASVEAGSAIIQQCSLFKFFMMQLHVRAAQCYSHGTYDFTAMVKSCNDFFSKKTWLRKKFMTEQETKEEQANSMFRNECRNVGEDLLEEEIPAVWAKLILPRHFDLTSGEMTSWPSIEDVVSQKKQDGSLRYMDKVDWNNLAHIITTKMGKDMGSWGAFLDSFHVIMVKSHFPSEFKAVQNYINKYKHNLDYSKVASAMFKGLRHDKKRLYISDKNYWMEKRSANMEFLLAPLLKQLVQYERKRHSGIEVFSKTYLSFGDTRPVIELRARLDVYRRLVAAMNVEDSSFYHSADLYFMLKYLGLGKMYPNDNGRYFSPNEKRLIDLMVEWANNSRHPKDKGPEIAAEALLRYLDSTGNFSYKISLSNRDGTVATRRSKHIAMTCSPVVVNRFLEGSRNYFLYRNDNGMSWIRGIYKLAPEGLSCPGTVDIDGARSISENTVVDDYLETELENGEVYTVSLKSVGIPRNSGHDVNIEYLFSPYVKGVDPSLQAGARKDLLVRTVYADGKVEVSSLHGGESISVSTCSDCSFTVFKLLEDQALKGDVKKDLIDREHGIVFDSSDWQVRDWELSDATLEIKLQHFGWETEGQSTREVVDIAKQVKQDGRDALKEKISSD